jgi:sphingosine kinase
MHGTQIHYVKASAYRIKPKTTKGCLSIDGEAFPFETFQVEVHPKLATLLSPHGYYAADFQRPKDKMTKKASGKGPAATGEGGKTEGETGGKGLCCW